jgi:predicted GNAT family N-acyltransferase
MIQIFEIQTPEEMAAAFEIRRIVFVIGQNCAPDEEYDEHENMNNNTRHHMNRLI